MTTYILVALGGILLGGLIVGTVLHFVFIKPLSEFAEGVIKSFLNR